MIILYLDISSLQNFKDFAQSNLVYVDKTKTICNLVRNQRTAIMVNAPKRSGKTLLLTTIHTMFTEKLEWWQKYCPNLWITKNSPDLFLENPYPIINLFFNGAINIHSFKSRIVEGLNIKIENDCLQTPKISPKIDVNDLIQYQVPLVIRALKKKYNIDPIILIDESDQPLINQIFETLEMKNENSDDPIYKRIEETLGVLKDFYSKLKECLCYDLRLVVICCHSMISQTTIFSGI